LEAIAHFYYLENMSDLGVLLKMQSLPTVILPTNLVPAILAFTVGNWGGSSFSKTLSKQMRVKSDIS
jgi:hypothetical protein